MAKSLQRLELELLHEDPDENENPNQDMDVDIDMGNNLGAEDTGNEGMFYILSHSFADASFFEGPAPAPTTADNVDNANIDPLLGK